MKVIQIWNKTILYKFKLQNNSKKMKPFNRNTINYLIKQRKSNKNTQLNKTYLNVKKNKILKKKED